MDKHWDDNQIVNKVITIHDILDIINKIAEISKKNDEMSKNTFLNDEKLKLLPYQNWLLNLLENHFSCLIELFDGTKMDIQNYDGLDDILNGRAIEIEHISIFYDYSYEILGDVLDKKVMSGGISLFFLQSYISISCNDCDHMGELYKYIKEKILNAPERYDFIIKERSKVHNIVGLSSGLLLGIILSTLLLIFPNVRNIYSTGFIIYPICVLAVAYTLKKFFSSIKLNHLYRPIIPDQIGYKHENCLYNNRDDNVDGFLKWNDIEIGPGVKIIECRNKIKEIYEKSKKSIGYKIIIMIIISIIVLFL